MTTRTPNISVLCPSIENCDPVIIHQRATPLTYALAERPILYGGGRKWRLRCSDPSCLSLLPLNHAHPIVVDVFVFNTAVVLWFDACGKGVEIPYSSLGAHAVRNDVDRLMLHLQVSASGALEGDFYVRDTEYDPSVEFELIPIYKEEERYYNSSIERLFTYDYFGVNKGDKMVMNTFNAISECSAMCASDEGDDNDFDGGVDALSDVEYNNAGDADDMDINESFEDGGASAVDVVFYDEYGRRRTRDEMETSPREVKRVKC